MKRFLQKFITLFLFIFFSSYCFGQMAEERCQCEKLTKQEREKLSKTEGQTISLYYPDGKIKFKETIKGKKDHVICYTASGNKCKEVFSNSRTKIKKSIYFDPQGKKYMVCKGNINY